jgi:hypothetical protein
MYYYSVFFFNLAFVSKLFIVNVGLILHVLL